ncbi:uncharacterized protein (UPF0332 family) [Constrictibacter sp. MBR-5]|jgi:uncharacterized protein (UPF0332 family)|uniref:hypothetical protein n=1 Tax=Constrictibacter sp. MBR-5 TaxID=3156467 RepID=UPI003392A042
MMEGMQASVQAWLSERQRPGNWLDVTPEDEIPPELPDWMRTFVHMQQICFAPEIRRRRDAGELPDGFLLWGAQLIQPHEGGRIIRLNEEVRGVPYLRLGRDVEKGGGVTIGDLDGLEYFDLNDDELDSGHFTMFWTGLRWILTFDFRSGRAKCVSLIEKSMKFLAASKLSASNGLAEPAIDTLHTACELLAKSRLILTHAPAHKWRSHGSINSAINREGRLGNIDSSFVDLFNKLCNIRSNAKYATGYEVDPPSQEEFDVTEGVALGLRLAVQKHKPIEGAIVE